MDNDRWQVLNRGECNGLLGCHQLGRVAYVEADCPVILPVNYAMHDGAVLFRTGAGAMWDMAGRRQSVAFEVDGIDVVDRCGWSVLVSGRVEQVTDPAEVRRLEHV